MANVCIPRARISGTLRVLEPSDPPLNKKLPTVAGDIEPTETETFNYSEEIKARSYGHSYGIFACTLPENRKGLPSCHETFKWIYQFQQCTVATRKSLLNRLKFNPV